MVVVVIVVVVVVVVTAVSRFMVSKKISIVYKKSNQKKTYTGCHSPALRGLRVIDIVVVALLLWQMSLKSHSDDYNYNTTMGTFFFITSVDTDFFFYT